MADSGDLLLTTALGDVRMQKPIVYQLEPDGHKTLVAGQYVVASPSVSRQASRTTRYAVGFQLASYDHAKPVVIDPVLLYSTYLGGSGDDRRGYAIAVDAAGQRLRDGANDLDKLPDGQSAPGHERGRRRCVRDEIQRRGLAACSTAPISAAVMTTWAMALLWTRRAAPT